MCATQSELRCVLFTNRLSPVVSALADTAGLRLVGVVYPTRTVDSVDALRQHVSAEVPLFEYHPKQVAALSSFLCSISAQLLVVYGFQHIIPTAILEQCPGVNLHPSLLPAYPGLNPWQEQMKAKLTIGGYTVHTLSPDADTGKILSRAEFPWPQHLTDLTEIRDVTLRDCGTPLLIKTLLKLHHFPII